MVLFSRVGKVLVFGMVLLVLMAAVTACEDPLGPNGDDDDSANGHENPDENRPTLEFVLAESVPSYGWRAVAYGDGRFLAVGFHNKTMYSSDGGNSWRARDVDIGRFDNITYGDDGRFLATGREGFFRGTSMHYATRDYPPGLGFSGTGPPKPLLIYADGIYVMMDPYGNVATSPDAGRHPSLWDVHETELRSPVSREWSAITYGNGLFVAVGPVDYVATSPDGINWTQHDLGVESQDHRKFWRDVTFGDGLFVAVRELDSQIPEEHLVMTSSNGIDWTPRDVPLNGNIGLNIQSVTYGGGLFVAIERSRQRSTPALANVLFSSDGINWTLTQTGLEATWFDIVYGDGRFVAVAQAQNSFPAVVMYADWP